MQERGCAVPGEESRDRGLPVFLGEPSGTLAGEEAWVLEKSSLRRRKAKGLVLRKAKAKRLD